MQKFLTKAKIKFLILIVVSVGILTLAGNISLIVNKSKLDREFTGLFDRRISVGSYLYVFPNFVILNNINFENSQPQLGNASLAFARVSIKFAFWKFLTGGELHVYDATLHPAKINYFALSQFLENNFKEIVHLIKNSPGDSIDVRVKESLLDFEGKSQPEYVAVNLLLSFSGVDLEGSGMLRADQYKFTGQKGGPTQRTGKGRPLLYSFKGQILPDGLFVDHLIFKSSSLYSKLAGEIHNGEMKMSGFTFLDTAQRHTSESQNSRRLSMNNDLANIDMYVLDIDGHMNFEFPKISIEHINFAMNNFPVTLKGNISLVHPLTIDLDYSVEHPVSTGSQKAMFSKIDGNLISQLNDKILKTDGLMNFDFGDNNSDGFTLENAQASFKGLIYKPGLDNTSAIQLQYGKIAYWTNENEHKASIEEFNADISMQMDGLKLIDFNAPFYDGLLHGKVWYDATHDPTKITSQIHLEEVDTDALEELLVHFAKFNGRMTSTIHFSSEPQINLTGDIIINDGQMTNFNFFDWVADAFRLSALKAIDFKRATAQFSINQELIQLYDIRLKTEDVRIGGYFNIDNQNLVTSKLGITLSKELLSDSPKFKPIINLFEEEDAHLDFDFRLSGNLETINFQWLPSLVKSKIQKRIPDFIERRIERNIDDMMEPVQ